MDEAQNASGGNVSDTPGPSDIERVLVPLLDTLILITGTLGHILVIMIISRTMRRGRVRTSNANGTDILLLCLSVADLLLLSCIPYHTVAIATRHWPFGTFMCKTLSFLGTVSSSASAFTLAALAFTRYIIVVHPTRAYRWHWNRRVKVVAGTLWVPAVALAAPQFASRTLIPGIEIHTIREDLVCFNLLSDTDQLAYGVCHFLLAFALPLVVIVAAYSKIFHFLRKTRLQVNQVDRLERYQSQVTHTSVLLVLAFVLCWLPSYGLMLVQVGYRSTVIGPSPRFGPFATFARVMATSSTVMNPVLYVFMSEKFRKELRELMKTGSRNQTA